MNNTIKLYGTVVTTVVIVLLVFVPAFGIVTAQETGNGSATIEYDYDNTEINYELNETLFESYRLQALSEPEESGYTISEDPFGDSNIQWMNNGTTLYYSIQETIYQFSVSDPYNFTTAEIVGNSSVPGPGTFYSISDFVISNDGQTVIYLATSDGSNMRQVNLSTPYDIDSMNPSDEYVIDVGSNFEEIDVVHNGQTMYTGQNEGDHIYWNSMGTAWNISTFESTSALWDNIPLDNEFDTIHFANDNDNTVFLQRTATDNITKLNVSGNFDSYSIEDIKNVGSMESFTLSKTGMHLFANRDTGTAIIDLDTYTMNEYNATVVNGTGQTIATVDPLSQDGSIPYQTETNESEVQLHWNAVTNSTYSGSSNTITINETDSTDPPDTQPTDGINIYVWSILFIVAIGTTAYSLFTRVDNTALLLSSVSLGLWIVLSYGALSLRLQADGQDEFMIVTEPAVAILCIGAAGICVINTLVILFDWVKLTEGLSDP